MSGRADRPQAYSLHKEQVVTARETIVEKVARKCIGMTDTDAEVYIESHNFRFRTLSVDGKPFVVTRDMRNDRVNLTVVKNRITAARIG